MSYALNEVEAMAKRATRGAGYPWGHAEEAAKATRWLCMHDFDGVKSLVDLLSRDLASDLSAHSPLLENGVWRNESMLCPLVSGALLSDMVHSLPATELRLENVVCSNLMLPFLAMASRAISTPLRMEAGASKAMTDGVSLQISGEFADEAVLIVGVETRRPAVSTLQSRAHPDLADWSALETWAGKTYAPATEESRLLGAGAGLSDSD